MHELAPKVADTGTTRCVDNHAKAASLVEGINTSQVAEVRIFVLLIAGQELPLAFRCMRAPPS